MKSDNNEYKIESSRAPIILGVLAALFVIIAVAVYPTTTLTIIVVGLRYFVVPLILGAGLTLLWRKKRLIGIGLVAIWMVLFALARA
jgi:hypothetical protein